MIAMRKWLPLLTVCLGTFMLLLDATIVNVALPGMARDLHTSFGALQWVIDAYTVTLAALVLGAGSIADLLGHRRTYLAGLAVFAMSSLACGLAPSAGALVAARAVQGVGSAAMFATAFALLNGSYDGRDRGTAYGMWGAVSGAASAVGPMAGGVLTESLSWRWVFFVNLPISALAIGLSLTVLRRPARGARGSVDVAGIATFSAAAASLTYGLIRANEHGWPAPATAGWLAAAPVLLLVFVAVELRAARPMLELRLLRHRGFAGVLIGGLLLTFAAFGTYPYTSIWLQSVHGLSPVEAGLTAVPLSVAAFTIASRLGRHLHTGRHDRLVGGGLLLIASGDLITATLLHGAAGWPALLPGAIVAGIGVGLATPTLGAAAASAVPIQRAGMAAGALNTARQLGLALAVAILGAVFAGRAHTVLAARGAADPARLARGIAGGQAHAGPDVHVAAVSALQATFAVCAVAGLLAGVAVLALLRPVRERRAVPPQPVAAAVAAPSMTERRTARRAWRVVTKGRTAAPRAR